MPRVFDCVILENEDQLHLLEARFYELQDIPQVTHVICEAEADHQGNAKPPHFLLARQGRFAPWHGRWNHVILKAGELPATNARERKDALRDALLLGVNGDPEDIIMHGNIDEIPASWMAGRLAAGESGLPVTLNMRWCVSRAGLVHPDQWPGTVAQQQQHTGSLSGLRRRRKEFPLVITAGTRLSAMGGKPDKNQELWKKDIDDTWPRYVRDGWCPAEWLDQEAYETPPQLLRTDLEAGRDHDGLASCGGSN